MENPLWQQILPALRQKQASGAVLTPEEQRILQLEQQYGSSVPYRGENVVGQDGYIRGVNMLPDISVDRQRMAQMFGAPPQPQSSGLNVGQLLQMLQGAFQ